MPKKLRIKKKRENYDTKNIPKNFGTAIHIFIKRNSGKVKNLLAKKKISYSQFYEFNKQAKEKINSLLHLRELWENNADDGQRNLKECYRIISFEFMRKHCLGYIFGSRIKNTSSHIRYRKKLLEGIERPHTLYNLKDYWFILITPNLSLTYLSIKPSLHRTGMEINSKTFGKPPKNSLDSSSMMLSAVPGLYIEFANAISIRDPSKLLELRKAESKATRWQSGKDSK